MASRYTRAAPIAFSVGGNRETAVESDSATAATRLSARPPRLQKSAAPADLERVIFAGRRFWGLQSLLRRYPNVVRTRVRYIGGDHPEPTHQSIGSHAEAVEWCSVRESRATEASQSFFPNPRSIDMASPGRRYRFAL